MKNAFFASLSTVARTIRDSLAMVIPILFIGSFSVMLNSFPIGAYQTFLDSFLGGGLRTIILTIQNATVGILALYITAALNFCYMNRKEDGHRMVFRLGSLLCCLNAFFILVGIFTGERDLSLFSGQGVFSAMVAGLLGSFLFRYFEGLFKTQKMVFVDGADSRFNAALHLTLPILCTSLCFAAANYLITVCFGVDSFQHLFMKLMDAIFYRMHRSYSSGLLFTSLTSIMWWFGIHGNNVLNQVAEDMFTTVIPGEIVSKSFIDTFVNMGGTGCTIGLLLALFIHGRRSSTKKLAGMALLPGVFNIGEMMVFGFPVIYNPPMLIPFVLSPMLCFSNAYLLTKTGFMPLVTTTVEWTTPALLSGYLATGSVRGVVVQIMNIIISVACYSPFVIHQEKRSLDEFLSSMTDLEELFKKNEDRAGEISFIDYEGKIGRFAKHLAMDLEAALSAPFAKTLSNDAERELTAQYQQLLDEKGECIGARVLPELWRGLSAAYFRARQGERRYLSAGYLFAGICCSRPGGTEAKLWRRLCHADRHFRDHAFRQEVHSFFAGAFRQK